MISTEYKVVRQLKINITAKKTGLLERPNRVKAKESYRRFYPAKSWYRLQNDIARFYVFSSNYIPLPLLSK